MQTSNICLYIVILMSQSVSASDTFPLNLLTCTGMTVPCLHDVSLQASSLNLFTQIADFSFDLR